MKKYWVEFCSVLFLYSIGYGLIQHNEIYLGVLAMIIANNIQNLPERK